jgi:hypothetical protein
VPDHDHLLKIVKRLPTDHEPFGQVTESMRETGPVWADCSMGCKHFAPLAGTLGLDWGVCTNPASARCGLLTFEHQAGHACFERAE